jgi:hypothetical protein
VCILVKRHFGIHPPTLTVEVSYMNASPYRKPFWDFGLHLLRFNVGLCCLRLFYVWNFRMAGSDVWRSVWLSYRWFSCRSLWVSSTQWCLPRLTWWEYVSHKCAGQRWEPTISDFAEECRTLSWDLIHIPLPNTHDYIKHCNFHKKVHCRSHSLLNCQRRGLLKIPSVVH